MLAPDAGETVALGTGVADWIGLGETADQAKVGDLYSRGKGVDKDETEAVNWFRKAAEKGNADAEYGLGMAYLRGKGIAKSDSLGYDWLKKAAQQGHAETATGSPRTCPGCQGQVPADAAFCPSCGAPSASPILGETLLGAERTPTTAPPSYEFAPERLQRAIGPALSYDHESTMPPYRLTRPYVGRMPVTPQKADGHRMDPHVSVPMPKPTRPAATAAPVPLEEPPVHRSRFHGFRM